MGQVRPGYARVARNAFIDTWLGREGELRYAQPQVAADTRRAFEDGDMQRAPLYMGQSAGLVPGVEHAAAMVERIALEAEDVLQDRLRTVISPD